MSRKFREHPVSGEAMAIKRDADLASLLFADPIVPNEKIDGAVIVNIRGPLEHHHCEYGDSYEDIYDRFCAAVHETDGCVVLCIDSPGGLVSGLTETVYKMRREADEHDVDVYVYVNELAASAAYAMSCVGNDIYLPPSGIVGSVGVISSMVSIARANDKAGVDVVTITSGNRKADGHPDNPIDDDAIEVERGRVNDLAAQFFALVKKVRGVDARKFEAGLFLGEKAVKAGLADRCCSFDEMLVDIDAVYGSGESGSDLTPVSGMTPGATAMLKEKSLIKKLAAESDPRKRQALAAQLSTLMAGTKKTYKKMEEEETEETDEEEEEAGNETDREEADDDEPEKKESKKAAKALAKSEEEDEEASAESDEEDEESAESEEDEASAEDDKDEEEALTALLSGLKGRKAQKVVGYIAGLKANATQGAHALRIASSIKAQSDKDKLHASIDQKLAKRFITRSEAKWLKSQPKATVDSFLKTRKGPIVLADEDAEQPRHPGSGIDMSDRDAGELGPQQLAVLEKAAAGAGVSIDVLKAQFKPVRPNGIKLGGN